MMLEQVSIYNYVLIQDVNIRFDAGFNVITGETGAGKSLLLDAIKFINGQRANTQIIGNHDDYTRVEAVYRLDNKLRELCLSFDLDVSDEDYLILSRLMSQDGKNNCRVNGRLVNVAMLKELSLSLLDLHSQRETQILLSEKEHIFLLDRYIKSNKLLIDYQTAYKAYRELLKRRDELLNNELDPDELAFAKFQLEEINQLDPSLEDYEESVTKVRNLDNYERSKQHLSLVTENFSQENGVMERLYEIKAILEKEDMLEKYQERFNNLYFELEALVDEINEEDAAFLFDESVFESLNERLFRYNSLRKKHGSIEAVLRKRHDLQERINNIENYDILLQELNHALEKSYQEVLQKGALLSEYRKDKAPDLERNVTAILQELLLEEARFEVRFAKTEAQAYGLDHVLFYVSMNKGMPLENITKVASGGELSRFMLAIKTVFAEVLDTPTLIFDEIDTGVSGKAALKIGALMKRLGHKLQLIVITHLAPVAANATHHYHISKAAGDTDTVTSIDLLNADMRIRELATIMAGKIDTESLAAAQKLFVEAQKHG